MDLIAFILGLWYNSEPQTLLKVACGSGFLSGCCVYGYLKFEKRKNKMSDLGRDVETVGKPEEQVFEFGDVVKLVGSEDVWGKSKKRHLGYNGVVTNPKDHDGDVRVHFKEPVFDSWHFKEKHLQLVSRFKSQEVATKEEPIVESKQPEPKQETPQPKFAYWSFNVLELDPKEEPKTPQFKKGDYVKIVNLDFSGQSGRNKIKRTVEKEKLLNSVGLVEFIDLDGDILVRGNDEKIYFFLPKNLTLSSKEAYDSQTHTTTKGEEKMGNEWIAFKNQIPNQRDIEISDDGKSWRVKSEQKPETKGQTEMKTQETKPDGKIKLNWRPITNTDDLEDNETYFVCTSSGYVYTEGYIEDDNCLPSGNFANADEVAFYVPIDELKETVNIPTEEECKKVLEDEQETDFVASEVDTILEELESASEEKQAKIRAILKSKLGI